ncbi:hypothetical protein F2P56_037042 [Juglans regia]|uniref:Uncharacterized protein n=2 Tax=Juglans regia TaxID=51240 RepID=A0A833TLP9_JUGRE|nr:uncharacterized protein LOC109020806 [Juglans regia]KAF5442078.1 hypothetical protein F2P56_037042 [Juglans regia]
MGRLLWLEDKRRIFVAGASAVCGSYERYLGLLALVGRSKYNSFRVLKDRVWQRISSWKSSFLSQAEKQVLIKAALQSIPTSTMSVFKLPVKLCKDMNGLFSKFWWRKQHMEGVSNGRNENFWDCKKEREAWDLGTWKALI